MPDRELRRPMERVGTLGNTALPPPHDAPIDTTESLLHRALREGDDRALRRAVEHLHPEMLRLAEAHVASTDDAEDVVQDTWVAALRGITRFEGRASLKTWLMRILLYRARSSGRRASRFVPWSLVDAVQAMATPAPDPFQALVARELHLMLEAAILELPARQREVVRLRDLEGWTPDEVCRRLHISHGNQRVLLHRGRTRVRGALGT
ncbi:RNA polymerase sigma factor [Gaopeijia maritima]|uniref:RNA polymerase sigma factor n=1 Tax=Gaopeijia maritima TaxID=3119007 RepID=A0ABU9E905_9BACT